MQLPLRHNQWVVTDPELTAETLVHSSFVPVPSADFVASVPVDGEPTNVWVYKRPYLDYFLQQVAAHFEVVVFTASLATYADVVLDIIDKDSIQRSGGIAGVPVDIWHLCFRFLHCFLLLPCDPVSCCSRKPTLARLQITPVQLFLHKT